MKFKNGHWLMREGVTPLYATECHEAQRHGDQLTFIVPTSPIDHRAATMLPALNVTLSAPMEGVVRVTACHHKGSPAKPPFFDITEQPVTPRIGEDEAAHTFTSGALTARVVKGRAAWALEFIADGRVLTQSGHQALAHMTDTDACYMTDALSLSVGECVYGLGERFTAYVKNGQSVDVWMADGGTCSEQAYKNIPFYMTSGGYGVFVDSPTDVRFEVASEHVERVEFAVKGETLSYLVIYGPTPKDVLRRYTALLGRPALPPAWSMGLWLSTSFTTSYDEDTVTRELLDGMRDRDIPVHVFHYDCFWMRGFRWCDFIWDAKAFPDPAGMLRRLKARGLRVCVWINPYIAQNSTLFDEGVRGGYLVKRVDGTVWQTDLWQAGMGLVDFTNPEAIAWYQSKLKALMDIGVDAFKTDFGERIPVKDIVWHDGGDPLAMHNYYTQLYNQTVFTLLERERGMGEAVLFARSATAGGQKLPVHWGGDCLATFPSMAETLRGGLSLAHCGFGFWSHDIGGFEMTSPASVYKRWCAFGLLSSHSRLHGSGSYRVPWLYDDEACDVLREFTRLKCSLMPYLYQKAREAHEIGVPVLRPMILEFPNDPACRTLDTQYMLGDALLVAPVFTESGDVDFYLPRGTWRHLLDGHTLEGGRYHHERYGYSSLPLFVREGTLLPVSEDRDRPDYDYAERVILCAYPPSADGACELILPTLVGGEAARAMMRREGDRLSICATLDRYDVRLPDGTRLSAGCEGVKVQI